MFESDKAQTAIVIILMIGAGVSGVSLFAVSSFYANTYALIRSLDVTVDSIVIADFNPNSNISEQTPSLTVTYRITTGSFSGDVQITRIYSYWFINNESLVYPMFTRNFQSGDMALGPDLDETITISRVIEHDVDILSYVDYLIELGPEGGPNGGEIIASGSPEEIKSNKKSKTAQFLEINLQTKEVVSNAPKKGKNKSKKTKKSKKK